jgi:hypothetical protein
MTKLKISDPSASVLLIALLAGIFGALVLGASGAAAKGGGSLPGAGEAVPGVADTSDQTALDPPKINVLTDDPGTAPGDIFIAPKPSIVEGVTKVTPGPEGPEMIDDQGRPIFFQPISAPYGATDFRVQEYDGEPVLTYGVGQSTGGPGHSEGVDVILNRHYQQIATVKAGNDLMADQHEFRLTPQGTALITAYKEVPYDLTGYGGPAGGHVLDGVVQEIDVATGKVLFEWDSLSHVPLSASYQPVIGATTALGEEAWDYFHINSVNPDGHGGLLISSRHTWTVFDVDRQTGDINWRLGGKESSFVQGPGVHFSWQHNALPEEGEPNTIRIFDNGNDTVVPFEPQSRVLDIHVDTKTHTATLVGELTHPDHLSVGSQGNAQRLPDGHLFVGWGQTGRFSEFDDDGDLIWDGEVPVGQDTYRAYRSPWVGEPLTKPAATATAGLLGNLSVSAYWNGATKVAAWKILAGPDRQSLTAIGQTPWNGLDTTATVQAPGAQWARVVALDAKGHKLGTSPVVVVGGS